MTPEAAANDYAKAVAKESHRPHLAFTIPGKPVGKERPRVVNRRAYTPDKSKRYEQHAGVIAMLEKSRLVYRYEHNDKPPYMDPKLWPTDRPVYCDIWIHYGRGRGRIPDGDNVGKAILDGLNRIAWKDDNTVLLRQQGRILNSNCPRVDVLVSFVEKQNV